MPGELDIINEISDSVDDFPLKEINSLSIRINYLKREIEKTMILNHDCSREELEFLLQRL
jgi:hypothetical protein